MAPSQRGDRAKAARRTSIPNRTTERVPHSFKLASTSGNTIENFVLASGENEGCRGPSSASGRGTVGPRPFGCCSVTTTGICSNFAALTIFSAVAITAGYEWITGRKRSSAEESDEPLCQHALSDKSSCRVEAPVLKVKTTHECRTRRKRSAAIEAAPQVSSRSTLTHLYLVMSSPCQVRASLRYERPWSTEVSCFAEVSVGGRRPTTRLRQLKRCGANDRKVTRIVVMAEGVVQESGTKPSNSINSDVCNLSRIDYSIDGLTEHASEICNAALRARFFCFLHLSAFSSLVY